MPICLVAAAGSSYHDEIEQWRRPREASLKTDDGWLTFVGLFWLHEGSNTIGSAEGSAIQLPRGLARVGVIYYRDRNAVIHIDPGVSATMDGKPVQTATLKSDGNGAQKLGIVRLDRVYRSSLLNAASGPAFVSRIRRARREPTSPDCIGIPVRDEYRVEAKGVAFNPPKTIAG